MIGAEILQLEKIAEKHRKLYLAEADISQGVQSKQPDGLAESDATFEELCRAEQNWFDAELDQFKWLREIEGALTRRDRKFQEISDHVGQLEQNSRQVSERSRSLRLGLERQMTEQSVMETMVSEIAQNLEHYKKFPIAQKLLEERQVEEACQLVLETLRFFRAHTNFQEAGNYIERFSHLKAKILNILSAEEISDSCMELLRSEMPSDPEIGEFLADYARKFTGTRIEVVTAEIAATSRSLKEEAASVRSFVRKFLLAVSNLCAREEQLAKLKFGESEISDEISRAISDQSVFELREVIGNFQGDELERLRDVIEQIGNSKNFPDPVRLGLGALRKDLQERVAVSSVLNVKRGGGVRRTLEILSMLVGVLDERTFQSVANEAVSVVLEEMHSRDDNELEVIGNLLFLREHVAMLECDLVLKESEIVFPSIQDLFSAGIWNIITPRISDTEVDVKAKIEETLRVASKTFVARTVQTLLRPAIETGKIDIVAIGNFWQTALPDIFGHIRLALSIGKTETFSSGAALARPLMQELMAASEAFDADAPMSEVNRVLHEIYQRLEVMTKSDVEQLVAISK